jgi:hypothetical protein
MHRFRTPAYPLKSLCSPVPSYKRKATTSWPVDPVTPLPLELRELMLAKCSAGQEPDSLVDGTLEVLERKRIDVGAGGV